MVSAHIVKPTKRDCTHSPSSGPKSMASSWACISGTIVSRSILVLPPITPDALATTLCATSNTPITIFHVLVTIRMAQAVLNTQRKNIQVSTS